jgi:hypothetical protein
MSSDESIAARRWVRRSTSGFGHDSSPHPSRRFPPPQAARCLDNRWPPINNGTEGT